MSHRALNKFYVSKKTKLCAQFVSKLSALWNSENGSWQCPRILFGFHCRRRRRCFHSKHCRRFSLICDSQKTLAFVHTDAATVGAATAKPRCWVTEAIFSTTSSRRKRWNGHWRRQTRLIRKEPVDEEGEHWVLRQVQQIAERVSVQIEHHIALGCVPEIRESVFK